MGMKIKTIFAIWAAVCALIGSVLWTYLLGVYFATGYFDVIIIAGLLLFVVPAGSFATMVKVNFLD